MLGEELKAAEDECTSYKQYLDELEVSSTPSDSEEDYELTLKQVDSPCIHVLLSVFIYVVNVLANIYVCLS